MSFQTIIKFTLQHEIVRDGKGNVRTETDQGGLTKFGIDSHSFPDVDISNLTEMSARQIYWDTYWIGARCDKLPVGFAEAMFDTAVNCGTGSASRMLQQALGVTVDGVIGPKTIGAAKQASSAQLSTFLDLRDKRYHYLAEVVNPESFGPDLQGWLNRVSDLRGFLNLL